MSSWRSARVEVARYLGEALAGGALGADALDELGRQDGGTSAQARGSPELARPTTSSGDESLELVDGMSLVPQGSSISAM